jgi:hypothetical protein
VGVVEAETAGAVATIGGTTITTVAVVNRRSRTGNLGDDLPEDAPVAAPPADRSALDVPREGGDPGAADGVPLTT